MAYLPMSSMRTSMKDGGQDRDPREREKPEVPRPPTTPPEPPAETPPETVPPEPGGPGGPGEPPPARSVPGSPVPLPPTMVPGSGTEMAAYRTPAFFTNRFVGGQQLGQTRIGPGTPIGGGPGVDQARRPAQLDEETLRALIARFGGGVGQ